MTDELTLAIVDDMVQMWYNGNTHWKKQIIEKYPEATISEINAIQKTAYGIYKEYYEDNLDTIKEILYRKLVGYIDELELAREYEGSAKVIDRIIKIKGLAEPTAVKVEVKKWQVSYEDEEDVDTIV